jgi:hypothetical protein
LASIGAWVFPARRSGEPAIGIASKKNRQRPARKFTESVYNFPSYAAGQRLYIEGANMTFSAQLIRRRMLSGTAVLTNLGLAAVLATVCVTYVAAQESGEYRGTSEQQSACMGDVFRLCGSEIPNVSRIVACLARDKRELSPGCKEVFNQSDVHSASLRYRRIASVHHHHHRSEYQHDSER